MAGRVSPRNLNRQQEDSTEGSRQMGHHHVSRTGWVWVAAGRRRANRPLPLSPPAPPLSSDFIDKICPVRANTWRRAQNWSREGGAGGSESLRGSHDEHAWFVPPLLSLRLPFSQLWTAGIRKLSAPPPQKGQPMSEKGRGLRGPDHAQLHWTPPGGFSNRSSGGRPRGRSLALRAGTREKIRQRLWAWAEGVCY